MNVDIRIKYTERILRVSELKKYRQVLVNCKESENVLAGYQWSLVS